jgi:hypothetical protein
MFPRKRHQMRHLYDLACLLAKQVLSQLSYTPTEELLLILKHFPIFCRIYPWFLGLDRALTMHDAVDLLDRAQFSHVLNR